MTCADFEVLLCDSLDGSLDPAQSLALEEHERSCAACAAFARDVREAKSFFRSVPAVEPPQELLTKIAFAIPAESRTTGWFSGITGWLRPALQPRFVMGMAMTILSFSMLARLVGIEVRPLKPADLHPAKVFAAVDDRMHRGWARAVKYYENLLLVYEVQTRLQEWSETSEATDQPMALTGGPASQESGTEKADGKKDTK